MNIIVKNKKAFYEYFINDTLEAGIVLNGDEVKSLRQGKVSINEAFAETENGELWLINSYIAPYDQAKTWGHEERRRRKLLVTAVFPIGNPGNRFGQ